MSACTGADHPSEAGRAANILANDGDGVVAEGDAKVDGPRLPAAGMYHLPDTGNVTTLELASDGTFRWVVQGCDFGGGDRGRWVAEGGDMVLLPRTGRDQFRWPGDGVVRGRARVVLRSNAALDRLDVAPESDAGDDEQFWLPGAWCAQCPDGQFGGISAYACDDPFGDALLDY